MEPYTIDPHTQHPNSVKLLDGFDAYRVAYKYVDNQPVNAFFVIPKELPSGPRPLLVRFHGGGMTEGEAEASLRPFFLELSLKHGAVILTPDYRLRPEHEVADGIEDTRSFWKWVEEGKAQESLHRMRPKVDVDVSNLLVGGESGGGYHAVETALLGMTKLPIKVLFLQYPALDLPNLLHKPPPRNVHLSPCWREKFPYSIVEEHLAAHVPGTICTRAKYGSRIPLMGAMAQAGKWVDTSGPNRYLNPMDALDTAPELPPIFLYQFREDESVPWEHTQAWAEKLKKLQPDVPLHLLFVPHGDHVFDKNDTLEAPWLKGEPLDFVHKYWPAKSRWQY